MRLTRAALAGAAAWRQSDGRSRRRYAEKPSGLPDRDSPGGDCRRRHRDRNDHALKGSQMKKRVLFSLLLFASTLPVLAQADLHDWNNVKNIAVGSDIWIKGQHGRCSGALEAADDTEIRLYEWRRTFFGGRYSHLCVVPRHEVKEVRFARRALSAVAGTAIGVGVGAGIGLGIESRY